MNILFFSSMAGGPWGGSEELWAAGARAALTRGHTVAVCVFDWQPRAEAVAELERLGAEIIERPRREGRLAVAMALGLGQRRAWLERVERFNPAAVVLSQGSAFECVARRVTRPILGWLTDRPLSGGGLAQASSVLVNVVQFNRPGVKTGWLLRRRARALHARAGANLFVCRRNVEEAGEALGGGVPRAAVVCNPVNLRDVSALAMPRVDGVVRVACVGRLASAVKGQDALLEALAIARGQGAQIELTLAGEGPDRATLEQQALRLGLVAGVEAGASRAVRFAGQVADVRGLWAENHALVLASHAEGTPLAMVEAMLLGRSAIVTDVGGCADWVRTGIEGWVVPAGDGAAKAALLAAALLELWRSRDRLAELGAAARARALTLFEPDAGGRLIMLVERLAEARG